MITSKLEAPGTFSLNASNWGGKVVIEFSEDVIAYEPFVSVTTVLLVQSDLIQCGYVGTPPMRKLEGEVRFIKGETKIIEIDIKNELSKYDPEELDELIAGEARLSIDGIVWLKTGLEEFKSEQVVEIEKI